MANTLRKLLMPSVLALLLYMPTAHAQCEPGQKEVTIAQSSTTICLKENATSGIDSAAEHSGGGIEVSPTIAITPRGCVFGDVDNFLAFFITNWSTEDVVLSSIRVDGVEEGNASNTCGQSLCNELSPGEGNIVGLQESKSLSGNLQITLGRTYFVEVFLTGSQTGKIGYASTFDMCPLT